MQESMNDEAIMYYVHVPNIRGEVGVYPTLTQAGNTLRIWLPKDATRPKSA